MTLQADDAAGRELAEIMAALRTARLDAGFTQDALAFGLPVRGRAISEWENHAFEPKLGHLIQLCDKLGRRLVIVGWDGVVCECPLRQRPGESWVVFERRRLAWPLKNRRVAMGMSQTELGRRVGVSRDSIQRWELARIPVRPRSLIVWARKLRYSVAVRPIDELEEAATNIIQ